MPESVRLISHVVSEAILMFHDFASFLLTRPSSPVASAWSPTRRGEGVVDQGTQLRNPAAGPAALGLNEDFLGNERADVAAKAALPAQSPHNMQWQMWRPHAEKFRLFWGTFGPTLARRDRQERNQRAPKR